jgi:HEXXH motif-containing protein
MSLDTFMSWLAEAACDGQADLANTLRALVYQADPELFEVLEDADPDVFLEPLLFAHFAVKQPSIPLPQIVVGYVDASLRPDAVEVRSDAAGTIYLPRIGYFLTEARDQTLVVQWDVQTGRASVLDGDTPIDARFEELPRIAGTEIEICRHGMPMLAEVIATSTTHGADFRVVDERAHGHIDHLATAMETIRVQWPTYHAQILATVRQVVLFHSETLGSFATVSAHGVAYLNVSARDDEVFFVEDLLHQCGHVIFNAATAHRRKEYVAVDPDTPIGAFNGRPDDVRPVYMVLHGLVTELAMVHGLRLCDERGTFSGRKAHELTGRLAFITHKAMTDVACLVDDSLLTAQGRSLYETITAIFETIRRERADLLTGYTMANQPYSFSYDVFTRMNPIPSMPQG